MESIDIQYPLMHCPGAAAVIGPSNSGKSTKVAQILLNLSSTFAAPIPQNIVYCHSHEPEAVFYTIENIHFHEGMPLQSDIDNWISKYSDKGFIIVLEDMQAEFLDSDIAEKLLSRLVHHHNCFLFMIGHTLFSKGRHARIVSLNFHYYILLRTCRDLNQLVVFGSQLFGSGQGKKFLSAYLDATDISPSGRAGYLFVNVHPRLSHRNQMLYSNILPSEAPLVLYKTA